MLNLNKYSQSKEAGGKLFNKKCSGSSQLSCNVCLRKIKNTLLTLELDPAERTKEGW